MSNVDTPIDTNHKLSYLPGLLGQGESLRAATEFSAGWFLLGFRLCLA